MPDRPVEIDYAVLASPLGPLLAAATARGLVRLTCLDAGAEPALEELARSVSPRLRERPRRLDRARRELDQYFAGRRRAFGLALDLALVPPGFRRRVLDAVASIPYGQLATYGDVAAAAGAAGAARAAGGALAANPLPILIPCHRVVRAGGAIGHWGGGRDRKAALIGLEREPGEGMRGEATFRRPAGG
jgi:methylated-DNA-[protein]-cysteine S-methyltransferase